MKILIKFILILSFLIFANKIKAKNENKILFSIDDEIFTTIDLNNRINYINIKEGKIIEYDEGILDDFISVVLFEKYYEELKLDNKFNDFINNIYNEFKNNKQIESLFQNLKEKEIKKNIIYNYKKKKIIENELQNISEFIFNDNINKINNIYEIYIKLISISNLKNYKIDETKSFNKIIEDLKNKKINYLYKKKKLNFTEIIDSSLKIAIINNRNFFYIKNIENIIYGEILRKIKNEESIKFTLYQIKTNKNLKVNDLICEKIQSLNNDSIQIFENKNFNYASLNNTIKNNLVKINDYINVKNDEGNNYILLCEILYEDKIFESINTSIKINFFAQKIEKNMKKKLMKKYNLSHL